MRTFTLAHKLMKLTEAHCRDVPMGLIMQFDQTIQAHFEENERLEQAKKKREALKTKTTSCITPNS